MVVVVVVDMIVKGMCLETVERGRGAKAEMGRLLIFCNARMPPGLYQSRSRPRGLVFS